MANMTFNANLLPKTDLGFDLGSSDQRWNIYGNIQGQAKVFYGTCATPAGTAEKAVVCPSFTAADLQPGTTIMVKFDYTNSAAVANLALNVNSTGALHINRLGNATFNDLPGVGYLMTNHVYRFYYSYNASAEPRWTVDLYYDTNSNSVGYDNRQYYGASYKAYSKVYRYMLLFEKSRGILVPANSTSNSTATNKTLTTEEFNPFGKIFYYNTTTAIEANAAFGNNTLAEWIYFNLAYSFNTGSTLTIGSPVYIVCAPQSNGMVKLHSAPISQTLPSSADGLYYIYLGQAYTTSSVSMTNIHPVYAYINGKVREIHDDSLTVNGHIVAVDVPSGAKFTDTTYTFDGTYDASSNKAATVSTVTNAINALDVSDISGFGAGKTLSALSETNGKISATFQNISITKSQISDFPTSLAPTSHSHGNIANGGTISSTAVALANGDALLFADSSNSGKIEKSSITFDGSTATKALTQKGTWETFNNYSLPIANYNTLGGVKPAYSSTNAATLNTAAATNTTTPTIQAKTNTTDRYYGVEVDKNGILFVNIPWSDTKVTAVGNHYVPSGGTALTTTNGTSAAYALNTEYEVLTGVTVTTDSSGHVTGVSTTRQKIKDTNTTYTLPLAANGTRGGIQIGYTASGTNYPVQLSSEKAYVSVPWTDTKQNIIAKTAKSYITGVATSTALSSTAQALTGVADSNVYLTATAGELSAVRHSWNVSGTEKAYTTYNSTTDAIDFIFV